MPAKPNRPHKNRTIVLPFEDTAYLDIIRDAERFREQLCKLIESHPNLFPPEIKNGFQMKDIRSGNKLEVPIRRIEVAGISYSIRPSFVLPSMTGYTQDAQHALFLRKFNVPFWALALVFGASAMRWWRLEQRFGRYSLVETTVQKPEDLPEHIAADEKHSWLNGTKVYIATICGWGCILGASIAKAADEASLKKSYGVFKAEAQALKPDYQPKSILSDAWAATRLALQALFPEAVLILCFLHVYLSLQDRSKYKHGATFKVVADKLWHCYHAATQAVFSQRLRRLHEWAKTADIPDFMKDKLEKLYQQADAFRTGYISPFAHRTSNMVDRLMQRMDHHLFSTQYFHGDELSAELSIRGWALIQNFAPFSPQAIKRNMGWHCPAEVLNQSRYHDNWLQNLLISTSLVGLYQPPQNPL